MKKIDRVCNKIMLDYLYPTEEIREFLMNDLNEELKSVINDDILVCSENNDDTIREKNWWTCIKAIGDFLIENKIYRKFMIDNYGNRELVDNAQMALLNCVFCHCLNFEPLWDKNLFTDKECVTYIGFDLTKVIS